MKPIIVYRLAQAEFERKIRWLKRNGMLQNAAELFMAEVAAALHQASIATHHRSIHKMPEYFRVGPTQKFQFSVVYRIKDEKIYVVAMAAPERKPGYWKRRRGP